MHRMPRHGRELRSLPTMARRLIAAGELRVRQQRYDAASAPQQDMHACEAHGCRPRGRRSGLPRRERRLLPHGCVWRCSWSRHPAEHRDHGRRDHRCIRQRLWFHGLDRTNPALILLHGGPGISEAALFHAHSAELERHFLIVYWEQRGQGARFTPAFHPHS
jgi:pimeloyl-ACP methyl ester carboxylesterase